LWNGARLFVALSLILVCVGLARPQMLAEPAASTTEGVDIVVVLDVSGSMRAADFRPRDRLHVAKGVIKKYLLTRQRDRIGLVVFAGQAYTQAPLTHDRALLAEVIDGVRTGVITDGTAIGDAVATGINRLRESEAKSRVLILITDGDNNAGNINPAMAAEMAERFDIQIFPILVGRGGRVPYPDGKDVFGAPRYVYMEWPTNPALLQSMAERTDGTFFKATDAKALAGSLQQILEEMDRSLLTGAPPTRRRIELYPLFLLPALLLLFFGLLVLGWRGEPVP
jgi:Ca-activated chloride channel family protein